MALIRNASAIKLGTLPATAAYIGSSLVWAADHRFARFHGAASDRLSTPHVVGTQVGDSMTWLFDTSFADWTPASDAYFTGKAYAFGAAVASNIIWLTTSGTLRIQMSDGTNTITPNGTAAVPTAASLADGQRVRLKMEYVRNTGGGSYSWKQWWSKTFDVAITAVSDWAQVGATVTGTSIGATVDAPYAITLGFYRGASGTSVDGKAYQAVGLVGSTVKWNMDANCWGSGSTLVAETGETWTLAGGTTIER